MESEIGSLEAGKQADVIAIDLKGVEDPESAIVFSVIAIRCPVYDGGGGCVTLYRVQA